jgi:hypothetical protein
MALMTWHRTAPSGEFTKLVGGALDQANGGGGFVYTVLDPQSIGDDNTAGFPVDFKSEVVSRTFMPGNGRRVRLRALRPFFKKDGNIFVSISLDDRAWDDGSGPITVNGTGNDLDEPLVKLGLNRNPRFRRIRVRITQMDSIYNEIRGFDIGYSDEGGGEPGAIR